MIAQSLSLPVPHVTVSNTSFHKASKWYGPLQVKTIDGLHKDGPQIALYILAELAVSRAIRVVQDEWSIPAAELDLCRIMTQLIDGPGLISHRLDPHIWLLTDGHEKDVKTWCPQMRVCNFSSSGGNDFGRNPSGGNSCVSSLSDVSVSDCKFAVFIHVLCTKGSSFWYNINPLSCHGIALNYTITRNGDFDKSAIS